MGFRPGVHPHAVRRLLGEVLIATLLAGFTVCPALAQTTAENDEEAPSALSWGYETDYNPRYVWRGIPFSEGAVAQTSAWLTTRGTTFGVWVNTNLESVDGRHTNEVDYYISRELAWRNVTVEPTFQYYTYRHQEDAPSTGELGAKFSWQAGSFTLFTNQTFDVVKYPGAYFGDVGLSLSRPVGKQAEMECTLAAGWGSSKFNETYAGPSKWALNVASFEAGLTYSASNGTYFRPHIAFTRLLDGDVRESVGDSSILNIGLVVGMEF